jgi:hypothetical protein
VLIEIQSRDRLAVHSDVAAAVDALLRGYPLPPEVRSRIDGEIRVEKAPSPVNRLGRSQQGLRRQSSEGFQTSGFSQGRGGDPEQKHSSLKDKNKADGDTSMLRTIRIYAYGVARNRLMQAIKHLGVPAVVVNEFGEADVLVTLRSYYRKRQRPIKDAERRNMPIYVLRANTINQMQKFLSDLFNLIPDFDDDSGRDVVLQETHAAINAVLNGERWVELQPAKSTIRRLQHQMARNANLVSHSYGKDPNRRVRIFRQS